MCLSFSSYIQSLVGHSGKCVKLYLESKSWHFRENYQSHGLQYKSSLTKIYSFSILVKLVLVPLKIQNKQMNPFKKNVIYDIIKDQLFI